MASHIVAALHAAAATIDWSALGPLSAVLVALIGVLGGATWLNRRNIARLTQSQAGGEDAKTAEMIDRMARDWLKRLEEELGDERKMRIYAIAYIEELVQFIRTNHPEDAARIPILPTALIQHLGGSQ